MSLKCCVLYNLYFRVGGDGTVLVMIMILCVMLKIKCDKYWPADSEPLFYGDLQLKILNESISSDWHVREMHISLVGDVTV